MTSPFRSLPEPSPVLGGPNCGWLNRLKNSVRNSSAPVRRRDEVVFLKPPSRNWLIPSWRSVESTRDSLTVSPLWRSRETSGVEPFAQFVGYVPEGADSLQSATTLGLARRRFLRQPFRERCCWPPQLIFSGNPRWKVVTPSMPQPDTTFPVTPLASERNFLPRPKGRSRT